MGDKVVHHHLDARVLFDGRGPCLPMPDTFNRKVQPLRGVGRARSALGVSVQAYKWCSCNKGKWECHNVLLLSNTLLYQVDNPNNPKEWILIIPNKK